MKTSPGYLFKALMAMCVVLLFGKCKAPDQFKADLAFRYAPIHFQDTDDSNAKADYITGFNYDGNWTGDDNWENLDQRGSDYSAKGYYSVVESETHWFILYAFFHPRDWDDAFFSDQHENDMEGLLIFVRKDGTQFGQLEGMITVFHTDFYSYTPLGSSLRNGEEDIDGVLDLDLVEGINRPKTVQEAKGHGIKAWPYASDFDGNPNQDGIIYYPSQTESEVPASGNDRDVKYELVSFDQIASVWFRQKVEADLPRDQSNTFGSWGAIKGDDFGFDDANAPWGWDDSNDGPTYRGEMALDPAHLVEHYFEGLGNFSQRYVDNFYLKELENLGFNSDNLPRGWPGQLDIEALFDKLID